MDGFGSMLFADAATPAVSTTTRYQWTQWQAFTEWWQAPLLILIVAAVVALVVYLYRRDSVELRPGIGVLLAVLRLAALAGLLLAYLDLQKWSEQKEVQNSRVVLLGDTSISMGLSDAGGSGGATQSSAAPAKGSTPDKSKSTGPQSNLAVTSAADTRLGQVVSEFSTGTLLNTLRKTHDVSVWRFDQDLSRLAMLPKLSASTVAETDAAAQLARQTRIGYLRKTLDGGLILLAAAIVGLLIWRVVGPGRGFGWIVGVSAVVASILVFGSLAVLNLSNPHDNLLELAGWREPSPGSAENHATDTTPAKTSTTNSAPETIDWAALLKPRGTETRLGESLRQLVNDQRAQPISGIVVFTDGGQNAGLDPQAAIEAAQEAHIPIYPVGLGSDRRPTSVRIDEFAVPMRAYPGDSFPVTADVEAQGMAGRQVVVELASRLAGKAAANNWNVEGQQSLTLPTDGHKERVTFQLPGIKEPGRRTLQLRVKLPNQREIAADNSDQLREADVEIVDRKNRVLLMAGGPTREYQFLRNQLRRDKETLVDVLLQTAEQGASQDANQILDHFPSSMQELSQYDTIVAFDPAWQSLESDPTANSERIDLLERWVSEEAGGLVLIAGPVNMDDWVQDAKMAKLRALFPVEFNRLLVQVKDAKFGGESPGAIEFTREGREAEFLWLDSTAAASQRLWSEFKGVYGYYRVNGKKPGATVYARFADPDLAGSGDELPIYMAGQLYGAGRVFYLGSGEIWRLRALEESYFDTFYTKLLRYVSQGRLLRGSRRGNLSVERDTYLLGSTVEVEARLTDVQHTPLNVPKVTAAVTPQGGAPQMVALLADPNRKGMFHGQFTPLIPGPQRIELPIPDSQEEPLTRQIIVKIPDLEKDNPQRNDALLSEIAKRTKGQYYVGMAAAMGSQGVPALAGQLKDQSRMTSKSGDRDTAWQQLWMTWLLCGICGLLCLEWLVRRLSRLA
jgi:hypothetical protein